MRINTENLNEKGQKLLTIGIVVVSIVGGIFVHKIYQKLHEDKPCKSTIIYPEMKMVKETSVAVNERGELMLIDRKNGTFQIYQDSVGQIIFKMYANKMYSFKN